MSTRQSLVAIALFGLAASSAFAGSGNDEARIRFEADSQSQAAATALSQRAPQAPSQAAPQYNQSVISNGVCQQSGDLLGSTVTNGLCLTAF